MIFLFVAFSQSLNILNRISPLSLGNNFTFQSKKDISMKFNDHPLFLSTEQNMFSTLNLHKTRFVRSFAPITEGYFKSLNVNNCVFSDSVQPMKLLGKGALGSTYSKNVTSRRVITNFLTTISFTRFIRCGSELQNEKQGGAIFASQVQLTIAKCLFDFCTADYGGAVFTNSSSIEMKYTHFSSCTGLIKGGAVYSNNTDLKMDMCVIANCNSDIGGALHVEGFSKLVLTNGSIFNNIGSQFSSALRVEKSACTMFRVFFTNNKCSNNNAEAAAVEFYNSSLEMEEVSFAGNTNNEKSAHFIFVDSNELKMKHCCIPKDYTMPPFLESFRNNTEYLYSIEKCPSLDNEIEEATETTEFAYTIKNSTNQTSFVIATAGIVLIPIVIMIILPLLCQGGI